VGNKEEKMTVTSDLVEAYLKCPTKCFLLSHEEVETGNAYAEWTRTKTASFRSEGIQRLVTRLAPEKCATSMPGIETLRAAHWQLATDFKACSNNLQVSCHAVERVPPSGRGGADQFAPIRFVFRNKLTRDDKLVIAFDGLVLSEMLGLKVEIGKIVHGDNYAVFKVKTPTLESDVRTLAENVSKLVANPSPPPLVLNRHCPECEFQGRCRQKAIEQDDLSLLGGMSEKERADFNRKGIFTVTQLSHTFRPRRRPKQLRDKRERYHHSLRARAIREKKIHITGSPETIIEGTPVYLDVEGLPDQDFYYLIGARVNTGDSIVQHSLWADSPSDEARIWQEFLLKLAEVQNPVLVHYGSFESMFLKRMRERHGVSLDGVGTTKALESPVNLLSVIFGQIYFPTHSNRLKEIAGWLGFRWSDENACGLQSITWRHDWEQTKAPLVKEKLVRYNSEDCAALELIARTITQVIKQAIASTSETTDCIEVWLRTTWIAKSQCGPGSVVPLTGWRPLIGPPVGIISATTSTSGPGQSRSESSGQARTWREDARVSAKWWCASQRLSVLAAKGKELRCFGG
jgi:predicted RecB family nuclease